MVAEVLQDIRQSSTMPCHKRGRLLDPMKAKSHPPTAVLPLACRIALGVLRSNGDQHSSVGERF